MNKITTKAIALFTALLILMTALPMSATAATADGEPVDNIEVDKHNRHSKRKTQEIYRL